MDWQGEIGYMTVDMCERSAHSEMTKVHLCFSAEGLLYYWRP